MRNQRCVSSLCQCNHGCVSCDLYLAQGQHHEGPSAARVHDHGHELGVHGAEAAVPGHLGDSDVIVALVGFQSLAKDVAELTAPHNLPGHGELRHKQSNMRRRLERERVVCVSDKLKLEI